MYSIEKTQKKKLSLNMFATLIMCIYMLMQGVGYIISSPISLNSLSLYAFVGLSCAIVILSGRIRINLYWMWYLGFIVMAIISTLYAPDQMKSISNIYSMLVVFGIIFALSVLLTGLKRMEMVMNSLIIGTVILMGYLLITGEVDLTADQVDRLGNELTGNANIFANLYMVAACSSVYFIAAKNNLIMKFLYASSFLIQMLALALSGGRKTFFVPIFVLFIVMLFKQDKKGKRHVLLRTLVGIVVLVLIIYALMNVPILYQTIGHRFESLFEYSSGLSDTSDVSTLERERMRNAAIELWIESPIFGHGCDAFSQLERWGTYSHCNYTELLCNHGIVGLVYYYSIWVYLLYRLIICKNEHTMKGFMIGIVVGFLICDYGAVSYALPLIQIFLLMAFAFIDLPCNENHCDTQTPRGFVDFSNSFLNSSLMKR